MAYLIDLYTKGEELTEITKDDVNWLIQRIISLEVENDKLIKSNNELQNCQSDSDPKKCDMCGTRSNFVLYNGGRCRSCV